MKNTKKFNSGSFNRKGEKERIQAILDDGYSILPNTKYKHPLNGLTKEEYMKICYGIQRI